MKNNKLLLIIGQFSMLLGFLTFLVNYYLLNNNIYLIFLTILLFIKLVRKTTSLQVVAIRTNLLVFDILFDNFKRCSATGGDKIAGRP